MSDVNLDLFYRFRFFGMHLARALLLHILVVGVLDAMALSGSRAPRPSVRVGIRNYRPGEADARVDAHDGPVIRWEPDGPFYRYAMAYLVHLRRRSPRCCHDFF